MHCFPLMSYLLWPYQSSGLPGFPKAVCSSVLLLELAPFVISISQSSKCSAVSLCAYSTTSVHSDFIHANHKISVRCLYSLSQQDDQRHRTASEHEKTNNTRQGGFSDMIRQWVQNNHKYFFFIHI